MIDPQTGYDSRVVCECRPCKPCAGQGETFYNTEPCAPFFRSVERWVKCDECHGTGRNNEDCGVHCGEAEWTALQVIMARKPPASVANDALPKEAA